MKMKKVTINDTDREQWVMNDEGLYSWWKKEMRGERRLREFVRAHRAEIDHAIRTATEPKNEYPPGYMQGRGAA